MKFYFMWTVDKQNVYFTKQYMLILLSLATQHESECEKNTKDLAFKLWRQVRNLCCFIIYAFVIFFVHIEHLPSYF